MRCWPITAGGGDGPVSDTLAGAVVGLLSGVGPIATTGQGVSLGADVAVGAIGAVDVAEGLGVTAGWHPADAAIKGIDRPPLSPRVVTPIPCLLR